MNTAVLPELANNCCGSVGVPGNAAPVAVSHISMVTPRVPPSGSDTGTSRETLPSPTTVGEDEGHAVAGEVLSPVGVLGAWSWVIDMVTALANCFQLSGSDSLPTRSPNVAWDHCPLAADCRVFRTLKPTPAAGQVEL